MANQINLSSQLEQALLPEAFVFLQKAARTSATLGFRVFLVGGAVRDMLLERTGFDLDLSVEGDAIELVRALAENPADVTIHHRFNTARLKWDGYHLDLARSREETYGRPGALPTVRPGSIENDLSRRDFSINAMAISLNQGDWGRLTDLHGGIVDIESRVIRVLHPNSFIDDATRLWRAVRYEQRLGFAIEPETLKFFRRDIPMLDTITPDRQRYELECVLEEAFPENIFQRAEELGLLKTWHPALHADEWLVNACTRARSLVEKPSPEIYLALLGWRLSRQQKEELIARLRLTRRQNRALNEASIIAEGLSLLASPQASPSRISGLLRSLGDGILLAGLAAVESDLASANIKYFIEKWCHIAPELNGNDLKKLGVPQGPEVKKLLEELRDQRLDGRMINRSDEETFIRARLEHLV